MMPPGAGGEAPLGPQTWGEDAFQRVRCFAPAPEGTGNGNNCLELPPPKLGGPGGLSLMQRMRVPGHPVQHKLHRQSRQHNA